MKKRIISVSIILFTLLLLTSCGNPVKGKKYSFSVLGIEGSYYFKNGKEVIYTSPFTTEEGTYTVKDNVITVQFEGSDPETLTYIKDVDSVKEESGATYARKKE